MKRLINLDYDGVLVDSLDRLVNVVAEAQQAIGIGRAPTSHDFQTISNLTYPDLGKLIGIPDNKIAEFVSNCFALQGSNTDFPQMFADAPAMIRELSELGPLVVVTSSLKAEVEHVMHSHGLGNMISQILDGQDPRSKTERIRWAMQNYQSDPSLTLMVGDSASDIRHGKAASAKTIAVTWGYQSRDLLISEQPDFIANSPSEVVEIARRTMQSTQSRAA